MQDDTMPPAFDQDINYMPYGKQEVGTYKEIVLRQIEKCRIELSKELTKPGVYYSQDKGKSVVRPVADQREVNLNSVNQLYDLMMRYFDEPVKEKINTIQTKLKEKKAELIKRYLDNEPHPVNKSVIRAAGEMIEIPESPLSKILSKKYEEFEQYSIRRIYQELLLLFARKNDLSNKKMLY